MGSATLKIMDDGAAYMYCPICQRAGTPNVPLRRQMHTITCTLNAGHQFSFEQLRRMSAEMQPMSTMLTETPNPNSIVWKIYVAPRTKESIEERYPGRVIVTVATLLDALADDELIFITGAEAADLKKRGLRNGIDIIAALNSFAQLEKERGEAIAQLDRVRGMLSSLGVEQ
jgi:hypothetical protein